jgi:prepilin-type N-terminal cleavage/methylation domain-containing protein
MQHFHTQKSNLNQGFTLVEVLVASVILFSVIATVSMVYRGAFISSEKANNHIQMSAVLPSVLANIRDEIRKAGNSSVQEITGNNTSWNVSYLWQANLVAQKSAPEIIDVDSGNFITPPAKYKLWQVTLILKRNTFTKEYNFKELSWTNE